MGIRSYHRLLGTNLLVTRLLVPVELSSYYMLHHVFTIDYRLIGTRLLIRFQDVLPCGGGRDRHVSLPSPNDLFFFL